MGVVRRTNRFFTELIEKFSLHIRLFDDNSEWQFLQIWTRKIFGLHFAKEEIAVSYFHLDDFVRSENNTLDYLTRVHGRGASFSGLICASTSTTGFD